MTRPNEMLVERLRDTSDGLDSDGYIFAASLMADAASALEQAQARIAELELNVDMCNARIATLEGALREMAHPTAYEEAHLELGRLRKIARAALKEGR
jgi:hypothetical protein